MNEIPKNDEKQQDSANEPGTEYANRGAMELERLKKHMYMSDMEKLHSFTRMLVRSATLEKAVIIHQK